MPNILDLMRPEDKEKALKRFERSQKQRSSEMRISQEVYLLSEFGYYYGWQAIRDVRENKIKLKEVYVLLEGARKVWYNKVAEISRANFIATGSAMASKDGNKAFQAGIRPFRDAAKVE